MVFYADLHIHSKYSRATSRDLDLEHMAYWARKKGVTVLGTGDFTHPEWFREIETKLVPAEPGLFRLRPDLEAQIDEWIGGSKLEENAQLEPYCNPHVRFHLEVEISTIYKKDDATRKVHHLIYAPDLDKARNINTALGRIGNLKSDGRPILGLDSRDLLEITLEGGDGCYLIPAHIWTPWFAALGSKSGFDSIDHCYGDLTEEIFAVETGLSSDPPMNWRLSALDRYTLVSNSDAHSPPKIGREATAFDCDLDYFAMRDALKTGVGFDGTVEFFPEEGKYHADGHRKCGVCLTPKEATANDGKCPVCGKALTLGVLHRINELADREEVTPPPRAAPFRSFIPLDEVLSEIQGVGPKSKRVQLRYEGLVGKVGSELYILEEAPLEDVEEAGNEVIAEAIGRMREGKVKREPGYDGEYGRIRLFEEGELRARGCVALTFDFGLEETGMEAASELTAETAEGKTQRTRRREEPGKEPESESESEPEPEPESESGPESEPNSGTRRREELDPDQLHAASVIAGPLLIIAGPGTGKTRTLTHRLAGLVHHHDVAPGSCLAITFTRRAASEMRERLDVLLGSASVRMAVKTFHGLGLSILEDHHAALGYETPPRILTEGERLTLLRETFSLSEREARRMLGGISRRKRGDVEDACDLNDLESYQAELERRGRVDLDDLISLPVRLLDSSTELVAAYRERYRHVSIDEYQDIDALQYRLVRHLVPADGNLCAIGDPDQAIYGFRGADVGYFQRFREDFPDATTVLLSRNYRSSRTIVDASMQMIAPASLVTDRRLHADGTGAAQIEIRDCASDRAEAEFVAHSIEKLIGGSTFFSIDSGRVDGEEGEALAFRDFAVLYRTDAQSDALIEALARSGMPFQKRSHQRIAEEPCVAQTLELLSETPTTSTFTDSVVPSLRQRLDDIATGLREDDDRIDLFLPTLQLLVERVEGDVERFLSEVALGIDVDFWDPRAEAVSLLTLHAAKGLEFPVVFIVGCEDGVLPLRWGSADNVDLEEERRLFFVGMTRAERRLVLSCSRKRLRRGQMKEMTPSPFLLDIEDRLLEQTRSERRTKKPEPFKQLDFFGS